MATAAQIGHIGETQATAWLRARGYTCNENTQLPGSTDIEATGTTHQLLVQVKTAVSPNSPSDLTPDERRNIVSRARRSGREAWLAQVRINNQGALVGEIAWTKLN